MEAQDLASTSLLFSLLFSVARGATPLIFAAMGGLLSERSGTVQIALEGQMLMGALAAAVTAHFTHSAWAGASAAVIAGMLFVSIYAFFVLHLKSNQIVAGTALNILAVGIAPFVTKIAFNSTGSTPGLAVDSRFSMAPLIMVVVVFLLMSFFYSQTRAGLFLRFAGEKPEALIASGHSLLKIRWLSLLGCGALAGLGGASLSLFLASSYSPNMTAGRGFMALAALIFGRWKPVPTFLACLFFASTDALQIYLQGQSLPIPLQFVQILPYLVTIIALAGFFGQSRAPKALGQSV